MHQLLACVGHRPYVHQHGGGLGVSHHLEQDVAVVGEDRSAREISRECFRRGFLKLYGPTCVAHACVVETLQKSIRIERAVVPLC